MLKNILSRVQPKATEIAIRIAGARVPRPASVINVAEPEVRNYYKQKRAAEEYAESLIFEVFHQLKKEIE